MEMSPNIAFLTFSNPGPRYWGKRSESGSLACCGTLTIPPAAFSSEPGAAEVAARDPALVGPDEEARASVRATAAPATAAPATAAPATAAEDGSAREGDGAGDPARERDVAASAASAHAVEADDTGKPAVDADTSTREPAIDADASTRGAAVEAGASTRDPSAEARDSARAQAADAPVSARPLGVEASEPASEQAAAAQEPAAATPSLAAAASVEEPAPRPAEVAAPARVRSDPRELDRGAAEARSSRGTLWAWTAAFVALVAVGFLLDRARTPELATPRMEAIGGAREPVEPEPAPPAPEATVASVEPSAAADPAAALLPALAVQAATPAAAQPLVSGAEGGFEISDRILDQGVDVAPDQALLVVEAKPGQQGSQLSLDGTPLGTLPVKLGVSEGIHELAITRGDRVMYRFLAPRRGSTWLLREP